MFSHDGRTVDDLVADGLRERGLTIAVAESCTGGLLGARLTERPGSSDYFVGGVISYANAVKMGLLGVPAGMLAQYGAVSEEVAGAMAEGARAATGADYALAVSGVAGPDGGTPDKPVGLVFVGLQRAAAHEGRARPLSRATASRCATAATSAALHLLRRELARVSRRADDDTLRLFVACDLPDDMRRAVETWQRTVFAGQEGMRLNHALHVTLAFSARWRRRACPTSPGACPGPGAALSRSRHGARLSAAARRQARRRAAARRSATAS